MSACAEGRLYLLKPLQPLETGIGANTFGGFLV